MAFIMFNSKAHTWLSNFAPTPVTLGNLTFPTAEHAFQAMKCRDDADMARFTDTSLSPSAAKRLGRTVALRPDWATYRNDAMRQVLRAKFTGDLGERLKRLDKHLVHSCPWGDTYWGVDRNGKGENRLGHMLMQLRQELKNGG